jgi:hypothetical protein
MTFFKVITPHFPEESGEYNEKFSQDSQPPDPDSKQGLSNTKLGANCSTTTFDKLYPYKLILVLKLPPQMYIRGCIQKFPDWWP